MRLAIVLLVSFACVTPSRAEVVGYTTQTVAGETLLTSLVVANGEKVVAFEPAKLIPTKVTHFKSSSTRNVIVAAGAQPPAGEKRLALLGDLKLTTGLINPGWRETPLDRNPVFDGPNAAPGLAVAFDQPVVNRPGDDVVVFEIQRPDAPAAGDPFYVSPVRFEPGLRSVSVAGFDIAFDHPRALPVAPFVPYVFPRGVCSVEELKRLPVERDASGGGFKALATGIDLSWLGYDEGATVDGLFFQDAGARGAMFDPILIAGLPAAQPPNVLPHVPKMAPLKRGDLLRQFLDGPMTDAQEIVFAERIPGNDHWYANFGHYWCGREEYPRQRLPADWQPDPIFKGGGRLCRYHLRTGRLTVLLDDPRGGVRDPQVHYDGRKVLFSYRKSGQPYYHLYEIQVDGSGLLQLTDGPHDDIEPTYLPDGGILFCSSRCHRYVNCWRTPVATLYRCDADGANIRMVSTNIEHDNTPWMLPDGRVLYMRWEYVDRSQLDFHHLWTINPDGTGQMVYYGNLHGGIAMLDAKPIPGTNKVVASFSPGHGRPEHMGAVTVVDPSGGPDDLGSAVRISPSGRYFRDPYAFTEDCFLVAGPDGISVMDGGGNTELVCRGSRGSGLQCHEPRPLICRPREHVTAPRVEPADGTGHFVLSDIYAGRNMEGVRRGEIRKLLVLEQLPKPVNFSGGPWPLSIGGTFSLARVLGTVPVDADGSASFEVPAMRSLFLVALNDEDMAVKRMQSFVTVQPGEVTGCVGCHEHRQQTPHVQTDLAALRRRPESIEPISGVPSVLDFPRDVQPVFDRHCTECHNPDRFDGQIDLTGDHTPLFCQSYWTIIQQGLIADGRNEKYGNRPPLTIGSGGSRLLDLLDGSHYDARPSRQERDVVRLWIDTSATYPGTYAALGSGMHPVEFPVEVMERRCGGCHGSKPPAKSPFGPGLHFCFGPGGPPLPLVHEFMDLKQIRVTAGYFKFGRSRTPQSLCNLTRPQKSLLLRAPLGRAAGGLALCESAVFETADDPDYQAILKQITEASQRHQQEKRFDLEGFRPNDHYTIQMQRFGVLPQALVHDEPIDVYAVDEAYWQTFWYRGSKD
jgi:hypothetical protein